MAQKKTNDYGTGASEVKASVNRAVARAKKAEEKKELAEKKAAKKQELAENRAAEKKESAGRKAAAEKKAKPVKKPTNIVLQYGGMSINYRVFVEKVRRIWKEEHRGKAADLRSLDLYVKPEERMVYYVINGETAGGFPLQE